MEDKENVDVNDNQTVHDKLNGAESSNKRLVGDKLPKEPPANVELLKQLAEQNVRISKFEEYGETVDKLGKNLMVIVGDFVAGLRLPIDLQKPKPTTATALPSTSATVSPPSVANKRLAPVGVDLTQTQALHLQPNADVEVVEHDNSNGEPSSNSQRNAIADSDSSSVDRVAQKILTQMTVDDVHQLVKRLIVLVGQKETNSVADEPQQSTGSTGSTTMTMSSAANDQNNEATTSHAHVDDQVANDTASTPAENLSHNGSNGNVGFEEMVLPVIPSASPVWTPEPPQQAISNEASTSSAGTSQSPAPVALNGISADAAASDDLNGDDSEAVLVKQSPSMADGSSSSTMSPFGSIFDTPKARPQQKKKRTADITIIDIDMDTEAERMTRSMARALAPTPPPPPPPQAPKRVRFNLTTPSRINRRRKTMAN